MERMWTRERLIDHIASGASVSWLFFWGHTPKTEGSIDKSCLSQWFPRAFVIDGVRYASAEHYMMAAKARVFADEDAFARVLESKTPEDAKKIGREVRNYDNLTWEKARFVAVVEGNVAKFGQHADLRDFLLKTDDCVLVEASPRDRIWGIGMGGSNPDARDPRKWRGRNLLGFALMEARERLRA